MVAGGKGALEGRVTSASSHHRVPPTAGVMDENVHDRIKDMDAEGRDIDFLIPGTWATAASGLPDVTLPRRTVGSAMRSDSAAIV